MKNTEMKNIPQVEQVLRDPAVERWIPLISRQLTAEAVRRAAEKYRKKLKKGGEYNQMEFIGNVTAECEDIYAARIQPVINATGVVLHTNMGRSPLPALAWDECRSINTRYSNLELSLDTGRRGKRNGIIPALLNSLTGAEAALVVNNNAAAVYLMLSVLAAGKEVIVSRGEQVQIGGGFRIPEIMKLSGARLVEVGTTNITTTDDYLNAVSADTAMVLKVHRSNFALRGFSAEADISELAKRLPDGIILAADQGSGVLNENLPGEQRADSLISAGAQLVSFSGDKILGGPQAGIIIGRQDLIDKLDRSPLIRTMRPGKTIYSLLESVLVGRMNSPGAASVNASMAASPEDALRKCRAIKRGLPAENFAVVKDRVCIGGGSTPDEYFDSWSVCISSERKKPEKILELLRSADIPVIAAVRNENAVISPIVLNDSELKYVKTLLAILAEKL